MNKKLIAVAVAGVVAAPAVYADEPSLEGLDERVSALEGSSISAYGRINNRIQISENDDIDMMTTGSRFGFRGSSDLGNGMSAFGRYEFGTNTDHATKGDSNLFSRLAFVGVSGPFGTVSMGQQWTAYFLNFGTHASQNLIIGPGQYGPGRAGNTIQYSNSFGPVSLTLDARVDDSNTGGDDARAWGRFNGNGVGAGVTISPMDNVTLAAAFDSSDGAGDHEDRDIMGAAATLGFGGFSLTVGHEQLEIGDSKETNNTLLWVGTSVDNLSLNVGFGTAETESATATSEVDQLALIGVLNMGGGLRLWGQFHNNDDGAEDTDTIALGVRFDF